MGIDLRLQPLDYVSRGVSPLDGSSHTILNVPRDGETIEAIMTMAEKHAVPLPPGANVTAYEVRRVPDGECEGEPMYGQCDTDNYGARFTYVTAAQLVPVLKKHQPKHPVTAYIAALKPGTLVLLGWH